MHEKILHEKFSTLIITTKFIYATAMQYWNTIYINLETYSDKCSHAANDHEEVEGIGQNLFSAGCYRLQ